MLITKDKIREFLELQGVREPIDSFINQVSNIYHKHESGVYERRQISILDSSSYWQLALSRLSTMLPDELQVLDFGCGTGYATSQLLESPIASKVKKITCFDLSPEMVEICKQKFQNKGIKIEFLANTEGEKMLRSRAGQYNLILTNAVLHHLLDLNGFFQLLDNLLVAGGIYIAGHEPHKSFYETPTLITVTKLFQKYKRIKQRISFSYLLKKIGLTPMKNKDISLLTYKELIATKKIGVDFPQTIIPKLVDIHVPIGLSKDQLWGEVGFDEDLILTSYLTKSRYQFIYKYTYSHIKDALAERDIFWRPIVTQLSKRYPLQGADCLMVFQKKG